MKRPLLLDLFCKAGGAGMGYHRAGFDVVGVDIEPQPRYPFRFVQADALEFLAAHGREFDAIHASPPCQKYCALRHLAKTEDYPDLIPETRELLEATGRPWVIENTPGAPLRSPLILCGTMFRLRTNCGAELRRHRLFESNCFLGCGLKCRHYEGAIQTIGVYGDSPRSDIGGKRPRKVISVHGDKARDRSGRTTITITGSTPQQNVERNVLRKTFPVSEARVAMGIDWMTMKELSQAIPPVFTHFIGGQLLNWLT
jgi:DNA (cytosine-5)-methyltransferase 1